MDTTRYYLINLTSIDININSTPRQYKKAHSSIYTDAPKNTRLPIDRVCAPRVFVVCSPCRVSPVLATYETKRHPAHPSYTAKMDKIPWSREGESKLCIAAALPSASRTYWLVYPAQDASSTYQVFIIGTEKGEHAPVLQAPPTHQAHSSTPQVHRRNRGSHEQGSVLANLEPPGRVPSTYFTIEQLKVLPVSKSSRHLVRDGNCCRFCFHSNWHA